MILNLKCLDSDIVYHHFKIEKIHTALKLITQCCFMASIDLKDAYYSVPLAEEHNNVTECIVCVQGHVPLTFSFLSSFLFFDWVGILWPQLSKEFKLVRWACSVHISGAV